jgi:hypothetical protein
MLWQPCVKTDNNVFIISGKCSARFDCKEDCCYKDKVAEVEKLEAIKEEAAK